MGGLGQAREGDFDGIGRRTRERARLDKEPDELDDKDARRANLGTLAQELQHARDGQRGSVSRRMMRRTRYERLNAMRMSQATAQDIQICSTVGSGTGAIALRDGETDAPAR